MYRPAAFVLTVFFLKLVLLAPARADFADDQRVCNDWKAPEAVLACTRQIQSGQWRGRDLAISYTHRGYAYGAKGDYDRAIADFNESIRLNPNYALAYKGRAVSYCEGFQTPAARNVSTRNTVIFVRKLNSRMMS